MAALGTYLAVFSRCVAVAVFHPLGALLRALPCEIDGEEGLGAYLATEGDEVVGGYLVVVVAIGVGLGLYLGICLEGCPLVDG